MLTLPSKLTHWPHNFMEK